MCDLKKYGLPGFPKSFCVFQYFTGAPKIGYYDLSFISWCSNQIRIFIYAMFSKKMFSNPMSKETGQMH